jgi:hypothetical protein
VAALVKRAERRAIRNRVVLTRCPSCNHFHLEIIDIAGPLVLCRCGWFSPALKEYPDA